ncbi:hypothetical protein [uncultured Gilliamella sp.]|uniref:hypothetical protein n=1 Tax=uncultured Gilliamella sp. TaxID=1193505 RepID=UPI0025DF3149|nr:hypothetical protein [uncultured Gilliamella sp.]
MWLFWLFEFLGFIAVLLLIVTYCHFSKRGFWSFIWKYLKWVALVIVIVWLLIAILCRHHLFSATHCYFRGVSMHANTKYSIYLSECQVETRSGSYVPIDRARALPGSRDHDSDNDNGNEYENNEDLPE